MNGRPLCVDCEDTRGRCSQCEGKCNAFECEEASTKVCVACRKARYCSRTCQHDHWPIHKLLCKITYKGNVPPSNVVNIISE